MRHDNRILDEETFNYFYTLIKYDLKWLIKAIVITLIIIVLIYVTIFGIFFYKEVKSKEGTDGTITTSCVYLHNELLS